MSTSSPPTDGRDRTGRPTRRRPRRLDFRILAVAVFLLGAVGVAATRVDSLRDPLLGGSGSGDRPTEDIPAPEFRNISAWINSPPITLRDLRGQVVLVDFWTYSCVNCIRTIPYLKRFYDRYHPYGLEIVGVHSPEFSFEKIEANVRAAVSDHGVVWPVAMDNDMTTWTAYRNNYWPHVYLIDRLGHIRYDFIGEGRDEQIETAIRTLLSRPGTHLPGTGELPSFDLSTRITPEIYLGYQRARVRGTLWSPEGYHPEAPFDYRAPSKAMLQQAGPSGAFFLVGSWEAKVEYLRSAAQGARVELLVRARDVYVVGGSEDGAPASVRVTLDGRPLPEAISGDDVIGGVLRLGRRDLYHVVHLSGVQTHLLEITADGPNVDLYTFTFG